MYKLTQQPISRKVEPKDCSQFLELNNFPGQRSLSEAKAKRYSELLIQGKLRPVDIAFALLPDGNRYLMNGQHVCTGCVWAGRPMQAVITYYKCESWNDAWHLFASFDVHASRTQNQIFNAARGLFKDENLRSVPLRVISSCGSALVSIGSGDVPYFSKSSQTADKTSKPELVEQHAEEVIWVSTFTENMSMLRVGAVAAMIITRRKNKAKAEEFWRKVQTGLGFKSKTEPAKKVHDYLSSPGAGQMNSRLHHEDVYTTCICWWNSFITGEPRNSVKLAAIAEIPKAKG